MNLWQVHEEDGSGGATLLDGLGGEGAGMALSFQIANCCFSPGLLGGLFPHLQSRGTGAHSVALCGRRGTRIVGDPGLGASFPASCLCRARVGWAPRATPAIPVRPVRW